MEVWTKLVVLHCQAINRPYEHLQKTALCMAPVAHDGHNGPGGARLSQSEWREQRRRRASWPALTPIERPRDLFATELIPRVEKVSVAGREKTGLQEGIHRASRPVLSHLIRVKLAVSDLLRKRK
jgi:hypothetical protein